MPIQRYVPTRFIPTSNRASNDGSGSSVIRGKNLFIRGRGGYSYAECYGGSLDLSENITSVAITGTVDFSPASKTITATGGAGTNFVTELHIGQRLETLAGEVIVVSAITSDISFTANSLPLTTEAGVALHRLHILFEMDKKRGTLLTGNAMEFDRGHILAVGSGVLRVNGTALTNSLTATTTPQMAVYQEATDNYVIQTLGFPVLPYGVSVAAGTAPAAATFTEAGVNTGTDVITTGAAHNYQTGQQFTVAQAGTLPAPLTVNTRYFAIVTGASTLKVATTLANSAAGTAIDLTTVGTAGTNTITPVAKNMPAGDRSIRVAKASSKLGTPSYGNPGEKLKLTLTAGQSIRITFPAMDSNADPNNPHDAWRVYATPFGGTTATATAYADSGAWYLVDTITSADLGTTGAASYSLEYLDAEIDGTLRLITFDNDAPPDAEYVATVAGYPVLVSCQGKATVAEPTGTAPGPSIVPFKPSNLAAAPLVLDTGQRNEVPLSPPETIIGSYMAAGRLYLMTANTLQIAVFTADPDFPVATRPFWKAGFKNPYALCFVNGDLYGFTGNGPTRSSASENVAEGSEEHKFALDVQELMKDWKPENVFVVEDPKNECVCYINSGSQKNSNGFWESEIIPFMPGSGEWSLPIVFTSTTQDRIITGAATVNGRLEFLMGGRDGAGNIAVKTYRFDDPTAAAAVSYSMAFQYWDGGSEDRPKKIKNPRLVGKVTSATLGIFGAAAGEDVDVSLFTTGNAASKTGAISLDSGSGIEYRAREDAAVSGLMTFAPQIQGTWAGVLPLDRIDELVMDIQVRGSRQ